MRLGVYLLDGGTWLQMANALSAVLTMLLDLWGGGVVQAPGTFRCRGWGWVTAHVPGSKSAHKRKMGTILTEIRIAAYSGNVLLD